MAKQYPKSPVGVAVYPRLNAPDTKFKQEGEYKVKLVTPLEEGQAMIAAIDEEMKKSLVAAKKEMTEKSPPLKKGEKPKVVKQADPPYVVDEEAGTVTFSAKARASGTRKKDGQAWTFKPALFDKTGKPWGDQIIGGGSKLQFAYEIRHFFTPLVGAGVTLSLKAVMVKELTAYQGGTADSFGFDTEQAEGAEEADGFEEGSGESSSGGEEEEF